MERPWGEISQQERKEQQLGGETGNPRTSAGLGWAVRAGVTLPPSFLLSNGFGYPAPGYTSPLLCPQTSVPPLYSF